MTTRPNKENRNSVHHRFSRDLIFFLTIAFVITAGVGMAAQVPQAGAERRVTHRPIESFTLVDQNGARFDLEKLTSGL